MLEPMVDWVTRLGLEPHPEGGWFRRIYTSPQSMATANGQRPLATSIYYLLTREQPRNRLHANRSDILHFLIDGGPVDYLYVAPGEELRRQRLAGDGARHLLVPGNHWKTSQLADGATHALIAELVTPGFDFADHRFATRADLLRDCRAYADELAAFVPAS